MQLLELKKHWLYLLIILIAGMIAYTNSLNCSFQFDDFVDIVENPTIRDLRDINAWAGYAPSRMIAMFTFAVNYQLGGVDVFGYHVINTAIHLLNAVLVYLLILITLQLSHIQRNKREIALFAALIFVVHPIQTQAVTYIVQRMASLATFFFLTSLTCYLLARIHAKPRSRRIVFYTVSIATAMCAMLTKQIAFTLPFIIIAYELILLRRQFSLKRNHRTILIFAFVATGIIIPVLYEFDFSLLFRTIPAQQGHTESITAGIYLLTQFRVIMTYLRLLVLPINQNLDYDYSLSHSLLELPVIISLLCILLIVILAVYSFRKQRLITLGIIWFFVTLSIESSIIPLPNVIFEHRLYLPSIGFIYVLIGLYDWLQLRRHPRQTGVSLIVVAIVLSFLTHQRNKTWQTEYTMWNDVVQKAPDNVRARTIRGKLHIKHGKFQQALNDLNYAIQLNPSFINARLNRGVVYAKQGQFQNAIEDFDPILEIKPNHLGARTNRANVYMAQGNFSHATHDFSALIERAPGKFELYVNRGSAYAQVREFDNAIMDFTAAINLNPNSLKAYANRGLAYMEQQQWHMAMTDLNRTLMLAPKHVDALVNRGMIYLYSQQLGKATHDFSAAIAADATCAKAYARRALTAYLQNNTMAMQNDLDQARKLGLVISQKQFYQHAAHVKKQ